MAHISRKELKQDQIRDTMIHGAEAVVSHQKTLWIVVAIAVVLGGSIFGWRWYSETQTVKAAAALEEGMEIFHARIRAIGEPENPNEKTYVDEKNKWEDAANKFTDVADQFSLTRPGRVSRYYAGLSLVRLGRYDDAEAALKKVESGGDSELAALARFQRAAVYELTGKGDQALTLYQQLAEQPTSFVPKPVVLLAMADHYRKSNPAEAMKLLNQIKAEYPNTPAQEEADKRLELLPPAS